MNIVDGYRKWREFIFSLKPEDAQISSEEEGRVFGVLLDNVQFDNETKTLWAISQTVFASGESSLKSTVGLGVIGLGVGKNEENIFEAGQQLIGIAQQLVRSATKTTNYSLPELGTVRFFLLTTSGTFVIDSHTDNIEKGDSRVFEMLKGFMYIRKYAESMMAQAKKQNT